MIIREIKVTLLPDKILFMFLTAGSARIAKNV